MTHRYYPRDMQTAPVVETDVEECPTCKGTNTEFIGYDESKVDGKVHETHICYDCEEKFDVAYEIPY